MKQLGLQLDDAPRERRASAVSSFHPRLENVTEAMAGEARAQRQEEAVLWWFQACDKVIPGVRWTPSAVHEEQSFRMWPITSVRRALTNLTTKGLLVHHRTDREVGPLGSKESKWSLAPVPLPEPLPTEAVST